jgi:hypothetical protein
MNKLNIFCSGIPNNDLNNDISDKQFIFKVFFSSIDELFFEVKFFFLIIQY